MASFSLDLFDKADTELQSPRFTAAAQQPLHIGFLEPADGKVVGPHHAAAHAFAQKSGRVTQMSPASDNGWPDATGSRRALEECDLLWLHDGDSRASFSEKEQSDLRAYLDVGGVLLLSGAAGRVLNDLRIEPTPLRVLGPNEVAFVSGIRVLDKHRNHPAFAGLDTAKPVLLTTRGCNALADFTARPGRAANCWPTAAARGKGRSWITASAPAA